ncbi:hypothetical protein M407DRAFT_124557 [Tulasnella calospora MUT 4182]|uniref:Uncharacterized protein n=1 Tax=Tulasnella calospora MUT 4182 TaxID=1051891 RepID=A0A0C3MDE1_9AGAM|nr:hypothetical protein M407DRAFT_124557 [Tulasnella calospora MUT 4182]
MAPHSLYFIHHAPLPTLLRGFVFSVMSPPVLASTSFASPCSSEYPAPPPMFPLLHQYFPYIPSRRERIQIDFSFPLLLVLLGFLFLLSVSTTISPPLFPSPSPHIKALSRALQPSRRLTISLPFSVHLSLFVSVVSVGPKLL